MSNLLDMDCAGSAASLRAVLLHRPDAHPIWHTYQVAIVHLRPVPGLPPPWLEFPDSSHEMLILALDPDSQPDAAKPESLRPLMPPNLVHHLRGRSDAVALIMFNRFVEALSSGELSPDTDHRASQLAWLERWEKAS